MLGPEAIPATRPGWSRRRRLLLLAAVLAIWLAFGSLRAPDIATQHFAAAAGSTSTVSDVKVDGAIPLIPPFWGVSINGYVTESSGARYLSAMLLCIEPITGLVIPCGSG
jgi:hypothetical protein